MPAEPRYSECYYQSSDGLRLYYRDYATAAEPSASPIICLPGLTRNSADFKALAEWLSSDRRVIAPDLRGRGKSEYDGNLQNYRPDRYVEDVWTLLDELNIEQVIVVGTSLGGWMSMLMAQDRPGALAGVIMNDIGPEIDPAGLRRVQESAGRLPKVSSLAEAIEQTRLAYSLAFPDWPEKAWRAYAETTYHETSDDHYDLNSDRNIGEASRAGVSGLRHDPWLLFDALRRVPTLVIRGAISDILSAETLLKMEQRHPRLRTATVRNRGHAPLLDEPEAVDAITVFLASL